jgi:hypothetical protein
LRGHLSISYKKYVTLSVAKGLRRKAAGFFATLRMTSQRPNLLPANFWMVESVQETGGIMIDVVIVDALRTPIGALGGSLASVRPDDLAALVIKEIIQRNKLDPTLVEEVVFGCANQAGEDNRNVARMAALLAGLPVEVAGVTVNRLCASGLNAINQAARAIKAGEEMCTSRAASNR